jgi:DNA modification methylase
LFNGTNYLNNMPEQIDFFVNDNTPDLNTEFNYSETKGRAKGNNKLHPEDRSVHDWYRFVLSFPAHLVREYLARLNLGPGKTILDPFCGTGTTLVECQKNRIESFGIERNPMAFFASKVKTCWKVNPDALLDHSIKVANIASSRLADDGLDGFASPLFSKTTHTTSLNLLTLPEHSTQILLKNSISPLPLHRILVILDTLGKNRDERFDAHERLALGKAIVFGASNLCFGPEVGVGRPKDDAPVVELWLENIRVMVSDLRELDQNSIAPATVYQADARYPDLVMEGCSIDGVITSPPYPNEKDYTRTTRLESVILGLMRDKYDIRSVKKELVRSNTRSVYKDDSDDLIVSNHSEISRVSEAIENRRISLGKTSGFERLYSRVTKLYFGGMSLHLSRLRFVLRKGARLAYVVGDQASYLRVMIRTGQILASIAEKLGYEVVSIDLFRTRLATATREQLREEVVILKWNGWQ